MSAHRRCVTRETNHSGARVFGEFYQLAINRYKAELVAAKEGNIAELFVSRHLSVYTKGIVMSHHGNKLTK